MEHPPKLESQEDSKENPKGASKTAIAAAALSALVAAGEPATAWDGERAQHNNEYRMSESERLKDIARELLDGAERTLRMKNMTPLRAQQFVRMRIEGLLDSRRNSEASKAAAKELLAIIADVDSPSTAAREVVLSCLRVAAGVATSQTDPHLAPPRNVAPDFQDGTKPPHSNNDTTEPYSYAPKNRAPDLQ